MIDYAAILTRRYQGRQWILNGDDYDGLIMTDGSAKPTKSELDAHWPAVKQEIEQETVQRLNARASALSKLSALGLTDSEIAALVG